MEDILKFDIPIHQSSYIKVIGVGGGGSNAVNHMYEHGIKGVDFIVCNTDAAALDLSPIPNKIQLGKGLGAGNVPSVAEKAASDKAEEIKSIFESNTQMVFITAGMGGGTGTGAAPVVAKILKEIELDDEEVKNILTVAVVTTPFAIEGRKRMQQAQDGIAELRKHVDAILIINNDKLNEYGEFKMSQAFALANEILSTAVKGISEIMTVESRIHIDFRDVNTVMRNSGVALMGVGFAEGEDRSINAISQAISSPLLNDNDIRGAKNVLLYISSSSENELTMSEFKEITNFVQKATGREMDMIWGQGIDDSLGGKISITLVATGFSENEIYSEKPPVVVDLEKNNPIEKKTPLTVVLDETPITAEPAQFAAPAYSREDTVDEMFIIKKAGKIAEPNSLEASLNLMERRSSETPKTVVVNELPNTEEQWTTRGTTISQNMDYTPRFQEQTIERVELLRSMSAQVRTTDGLEKIEKTPAYISRGIQLEEPVHSSQSQAPRFNLTEDGRVVENSYLNNNVD